LADKLFVGLAGLSAQVMVKVRHREPPAVRRGEVMEQRQQHHRVQPAGNGDQNCLAVAEKSLRANRRFDLLWQIGIQTVRSLEFKAGWNKK
jgi:hypothetical protein